jgi:hypothetical protein
VSDELPETLNICGSVLHRIGAWEWAFAAPCWKLEVEGFGPGRGFTAKLTCGPFTGRYYHSKTPEQAASLLAEGIVALRDALEQNT